jgi:hypothetical protein
VIRFHFGERLIYAPTAAMIYQFREVLGGRATRVADLEQPALPGSSRGFGYKVADAFPSDSA